MEDDFRPEDLEADFHFGSSETEEELSEFAEVKAEHLNQPEEVQRTHTCCVCKAVSEHFYLNYGAPTCFSCRAFFRRAHQKTKTPTFTCKNDNLCVITVEDRKCRKCRYELCIKAGMRPEYVLDQEQKKVRFRKLIKRKAEQNPDLANSDRIIIEKPNLKDKKEQNGEKRPGRRGRKPKAVKEADARESMKKEEELKIKQEQEPLEPSYQSPNGDSTLSTKSVKTEPEPAMDTDPAMDDPLAVLAKEFGLESNQQLNMTAQDVADTLEAFESSPSPVPSVTSMPNASVALGGSTGPQPGPSTMHMSQDSMNQLLLSVPPGPGVPNNCEVMSGASNMDCSIYTALAFMTEQINLCWTSALNNAQFNPAFVAELQRLHRVPLLGQPAAAVSVSQALFRDHLAKLAKIFETFAMQQPQFAALSTSDQRTLLERNAPLFVQLLLCKYLTHHSQTASGQIPWFTLGKEQDTHESHYVSLATLNSALDLFPSASDCVTYDSLCAEGATFNVHWNSMPLLALVILYSSDDTLLFDDATVLEVHGKNVLEMVQWQHQISHGDCFTYEQARTLVVCLEKMASLFDRSSNLGSSSFATSDYPQSTRECGSGSDRHNQLASYARGATPKHRTASRHREPTMVYTSEEESWLQTQFSKFDSSFAEVSFGEDLIHEFVMYSFDVPLSRKTSIMQKSVFYAVALSVTKLGSCESGKAQLTYGVGHLDDKFFNQNFSAIMNKGSKLKKVSLMDVNWQAGLLNPDLLKRYNQLLRNLNDLVCNDDNFRLLTLITMFSGQESLNPTKSLYNRYMTLFKRRLLYHGGSVQDYDRILIGLRDVKELAFIIKQVTLKSRSLPE